MSVVFIDTETTGLDPEHHEVWEVAIIDPEDASPYWSALIRPRNLLAASPDALRITGYYWREAQADDWMSRSDAAAAIALRTSGKHLVGAVPSFDAAFLNTMLRREGLVPAWHYHLVDVEALAAGKLGMRPPWNSRELYEALDLDIDHLAPHRAMDDARLAMKVYGAVMGSRT